MKKNLIMRPAALVLASALVLANVGCDDFLKDEVVSPNDPESATIDQLLANIEVATFATFNGQLARQSEIMIQRIAGTSAGSQSLEIANYVITDQTNSNEWEVIFNGVVANANILIERYGAENPHYAGVAKVLKALSLGAATDIWGDIPFAEAGRGLDGILEPVFEPQQQVIAGIQSLLDEAIADLSRPAEDNKFTPGTDDYIFQGDAARWIKTAYILKARYANRLSQRDPAGSAASALGFLQQAGLTDGSDDALMIFFNAGNSLNQWFAYENDRGGYLRANEAFVDDMIANADPRIPMFLALDDNGGYSGTPFDDPDVTGTSYLGSHFATADGSLPLVTFVEAKFIEAEAALRSGDAGTAATAHNDAVKASILEVTGASDPAYEGAFASETAGTITLEKIMQQKYVALFTQLEGYSDWRRTGFPALVPNPNGTSTGIPLRLPTPQQERLYNSNAVVVTDLLAPVWWDQ
ncbi:SusD/RagB family nutrient-binding outer membrane lipoprotein [bacterium]|nr:SusD/RagB family nutrient-binding outer membrane lipoprotein [bacterium]